MRKKVLISALFLILITTIVSRYLHFGSRSARASDEMCFELNRPYYPLRHWSWSGIFPLEGGFIPDPHFLCSQPEPFPDSVGRELGGSGEFQIVDVNPFFNDESSEIELLIRSGSSVYDYSLQFPKRKRVQAIIATPSVPAHMFLYKDKIELLADFEGPAKGIYTIPLPLRSGTKLDLIPVTNSEFDLISREFKNAGRDLTVRNQFCESRSWPFISFYEKYAESCGKDAETHGVAASRFDEFWRNAH